jgi:hypothetical protein
MRWLKSWGSRNQPETNMAAEPRAMNKFSELRNELKND